MSVLRKELFEIWHEETDTKNKNSAVLNHVLTKFQLSANKEDITYVHVKKMMKNLNSNFTHKWKKSSRSLEMFRKRHQEWLDEIIVVVPPEVPKARGKGRPSKEFPEVGSQTKRQKILPLVESYSTEELTFATSTSLRQCGKKDAALMVQVVTSENPNRATSIKKILSPSTVSAPIKYTPEEALALYIDGRFTKQSYKLLRVGAKARNADIYPSYNILKNAKEASYPDKGSIIYSDTTAEVKLQALVDHTARKLIMAQTDVLQQMACNLSNVNLIYKWGCDGSAGHSMYKQKFGESSKSQTDSYLFAVCLVPLRLQTHSSEILWDNPRPSSPRFCRPIKIIFEKENIELSKKEIENVENQIKDISPTKVSIGMKDIFIYHRFQLTMIDGKIFGVITESSTQTCGICGATPKIMNNLEEVIKLNPNENQYNFGLSTLHAWIRCLETLLHISYRLTVKKWQIRDVKDKNAVKERKKIVQTNLKNEMGLLVDIPKPGFGTTNDGNTVRRFFKNPFLTSSITGIDEDLIKRFSIILRTLSSGYAINGDAFQTYAIDTAVKFVTLYPWYYMPSSVHKILIHGANIIENAVLPIGMLSEEALESRNKDLRKYRELHTRKMSRTKTMEDLFHALLFSSDPVISILSKNTSTISKKETVLDEDIANLLADPEILALHRPSASDDESLLDNSSEDDSSILPESDTD